VPAARFHGYGELVRGAAATDLPPDRVSAIRSPSSGRLDHAKERANYAPEGTLPRQASRLGAGSPKAQGYGRPPVATNAGYEVLHVEPLEGIALDLLHLWGGPRSASPR
jgi:hypothetical protein